MTWGHKYTLSIYVKGPLALDELAEAMEELNVIFPGAHFLGVMVEAQEEEPKDQG